MGSTSVVAGIITPNHAVTKTKEKSNFSDLSYFFCICLWLDIMIGQLNDCPFIFHESLKKLWRIVIVHSKSKFNTEKQLSSTMVVV